jgi:N-acetylglucosamine-6-phosphate deacetylase
MVFSKMNRGSGGIYGAVFMLTLVRGGRIITPDQTIEDGVVVIEDGKIAAIENRWQVAENPPSAHVVDANGLWVTPGLFDVHVHGSAGVDVMDATPDALHRMADYLLDHGVTSFLATTMASSFKATMAAIENVVTASQPAMGAQALGVHLEGPYLSLSHRGAQPVEFLRPPDPHEYGPWLESGAVRLVAVAPELPGALPFIEHGVNRGLRFSVAHSGASYEQVMKAADIGLSQATHTFNGMLGIHHREPGTVGAVLTDDRIFAEVIADGTHVHPAVIKLLVRAKGPDRTILITDAIRATGLPDGHYTLGGIRVVVKDGIPRTETGGLAGSTLTLNRAIKNVIQFAGVSINQAVAMATRVPADALGLAGQKGTIQPGADADIVLFDDDFNAVSVLIAGRPVLDKRPAGFL